MGFSFTALYGSLEQKTVFEVSYLRGRFPSFSVDISKCVLTI